MSSLLVAIVVLGVIGIIRTRVRRNGVVAGVIFSFFPIVLFVAALLFLLVLGILFKQAAYNFSDEGEKAQEAWRQEQIASTGADPCAELYAQERQRQQAQDLADSGAIGDGEVLTNAVASNPYISMTWEDRQAALAHAHEMREKCPPLDYIESQK